MSVPPRAIGEGDVVVTPYTPDRWVAAQVVEFSEWDKTVVLADLAWSGPEPSSLSDLGDELPEVVPSSWHRVDWLLPRGYRVLGNAPHADLPKHGPGYSGAYWGVGEAAVAFLDHDPYAERALEPGLLWLGDFIAAEVARPGARPGVRHVSASEYAVLDCAQLVARFPSLVRLSLHGGTLLHFRSLCALRLRELTIGNVFCLAAADALGPGDLPQLEVLDIDGAQQEFGQAMRALWRNERRRGTAVHIGGLRAGPWTDNGLLGEWAFRLADATCAQINAEVESFLSRIEERRPHGIRLVRELPQEIMARLTLDGRTLGQGLVNILGSRLTEEGLWEEMYRIAEEPVRANFPDHSNDAWGAVARGLDEVADQ